MGLKALDGCLWKRNLCEIRATHRATKIPVIRFCTLSENVNTNQAMYEVRALTRNLKGMYINFF